MKSAITIKDRQFSVFISSDKIAETVEVLATKLTQEYQDKNPVFIVVLNGSFMFAADLFKKLCIPAEITFIKAASYLGTSSSGEVKILLGLNENLAGREVVIIEDIVDSGLTMKEIFAHVKSLGPVNMKICTLLFKPQAYKADLVIDYVGLEISNDFIVGYGLDYNGYGRNLPDIYKVN